MQTERPLLFSTPMVKAILEGRKTVTRRVMNPQPSADVRWDAFGYTAMTPDNHISGRGWFKPAPEEIGCPAPRYGEKFFKIPYGKPKDQLWIRETWRYSDDLKHPYDYKAQFELEYNAEYLKRTKGTWRPSIFMPKAACRIRLQIQSVRVERLHDITEEECFREGIDAENEDYCAAEHYQLGGSPIQGGSPARFAYIALWSKINGRESWDANPFVWVLNFKKL